MDYYILARGIVYLLQADPVSSVERIGFLATVGLVFTALIVWAIKQLFAYFTTRLDKKDDRIVEQQDKHSEVQAKMLEDRRSDLLQVREVLNNQIQAQRDLTQAQRELAREQVEGFKSLASGLQALADEIRRGR